MCGIAGKLWFDPARPADAPGVAALTAALAHRGPDDSGFAQDGPLAFGHRRLSIVDLSPRGHQPMASSDGSLLLVANCEIWNHRALRAELAAAGHSFRGDCDAEVILPLYRQWYEREGPDFVRRLDGMFAFALWDSRQRRLLLARDPVGKKPLVYAMTAEGLVFASELQALRRDPLVDRTPDGRALADYLAFRAVPHPRTAYRGASKLPPGTVMVVENGRATQRRTWRLAAGCDTSEAPTLDEAADEVLARLRAAVRKRLMADVPLGAFLSGGLDSAAVVALMAEAGGAPVRTFTIGFAESDYDEAAGARKVSRLFGTQHHEEVVRPDAVALIDELLGHYGEPFADSSAMPTFLVSKLAREHVKVVLTGDGGDEAFAGYDRYRALALADCLDGTLAAPLRLALSAVASAAVATGAGGALVSNGEASFAGERGAGARLVRFVDSLDRTPRQRNHDWRVAMTAGQIRGLLTPDGQAFFGEPSFYGADVDLPLPLNEALLLDLERYLPDDILVKLDIASMAHGLEARCPFLDRDLLEYAASLPGRLKLGRARGRMASKLVLRHALRRLLPADVLSGPKRGFGVPLEHWFRGPLAEHARDVLLSPAARGRGLFRPAAVESLLDDHAQNRVAAHEPLFTLLVLERWFLSEDQRC